MSNSSLVCFTRISPNKNSPRNHAIDTITIHCMAGNLKIESCGDLFSKPNTQASSNYGIGSDGRIALFVDEGDRSWCSSSASNDNRAITIEVANDGGAETGWHVSDKALESLIKLCADICRRNGIKELKWKGDKSLIGNVSEQNMTVHRWFKNKDCPGDYLYNKHGYIASEVNKLLGNNATQQANPTTGFPKCPFAVRVIIDDLNIRTSASTSSASKGFIEKGTYTITEVQNGFGKLKSGAGWIYVSNASYVKVCSTVSESTESAETPGYKVKVTANVLNVRAGAGTNYKVNTTIRKNEVYTIVEEKNGWGKLKSGAGWISLNYTRKC